MGGRCASDSHGSAEPHAEDHILAAREASTDDSQELLDGPMLVIAEADVRETQVQRAEVAIVELDTRPVAIEHELCTVGAHASERRSTSVLRHGRGPTAVPLELLAEDVAKALGALEGQPLPKGIVREPPAAAQVLFVEDDDILDLGRPAVRLHLAEFDDGSDFEYAPRMQMLTCPSASTPLGTYV